jgi:hypothetical protein
MRAQGVSVVEIAPYFHTRLSTLRAVTGTVVTCRRSQSSALVLANRADSCSN